MPGEAKDGLSRVKHGQGGRERVVLVSQLPARHGILGQARPWLKCRGRAPRPDGQRRTG